MRIILFVDFWNFQLSWNDYWKEAGEKERIRIPWRDVFPQVVINSIDNTAHNGGTHVYASVDVKKESSKKLRNFLNNVMSGFPGYAVTIKERRPIGSFDCPECHEKILNCPHCSEEIRRTVEKGVDAALSVDLIKYALNDVYDTAVLVSHDADYIPAVNFVQERGKEVVNLGFRNSGFHLKKSCMYTRYVEDLTGDLLSP